VDCDRCRSIAQRPSRRARKPPAARQAPTDQNTGTILRTCACLGAEAHIIEPAGFPVTDRAFRRAGMDYLPQVPHTLAK
jgi:hypothetical protein